MSDPVQKLQKSATDKAAKLLRQGDPEGARDQYAAAIRSLGQPREADQRRAIAEMLTAIGEIELSLDHEASALSAFEKAEEIAPLASKACHHLVERRIDSDKALSHDMVPLYVEYLRSGQSERIRIGALRRLATILHVSLRDRRSEVVWRMEMLKKIHRLRPEINFPKTFLGRAHYLRSEFREAVPYFEAIVADGSPNQQILNLLGRSLEKIGRLEQAREAYRMSLERVPDQAGIHFRIGRIDLVTAQA